MVDIIIIGAGIAGAFVARELARYQMKIILLDKENDVANKTTAANSAIIHAGYDAIWSSKKGKYNSMGNAMFDKICEELDVPFKRCGSLVIGFDEEDQKTIQELYLNGLKNNVPNLKILNKEEVLSLEPNLSENLICALYAPTAGIISPWELAIALVENAVENGIELKLETRVLDIKKQENYFTVITDKGEINTQYVINCAGVYADQINNKVAKASFEIFPRKGHYFVLDKDVSNLVNHVIFQCPTKKGKGVLVAPTVHGNILVGPDSEMIEDKEDLSTTTNRLQYIKEAALLTSHKIPFNKVIRSFAGLRATSSTGDFIIEESKEVKGFINLAGFDSPGLSSIPAVAQEIVKLMDKITGGMKVKEAFNPRRRKVIRFIELSEEEKINIVKENPSYGRIICRCENITEAEIVDAIRRKAGATSVKGVKKRVRPGTGRCQGGFCTPRVMEILARELGKDMKDIPYDNSESYILTEETKSND